MDVYVEFEPSFDRIAECKGEFHLYCIRQWLKTSKNMPLLSKKNKEAPSHLADIKKKKKEKKEKKENGKGPYEGVGGTMKRKADNLVKSRHVIRTAKEFNKVLTKAGVKSELMLVLHGRRV